VTRMHASGSPGAGQCTEPAQILEWLTIELSERLEIPAIELDPAVPIDHYGLDSVEGVELVGDLERWLGVELSATLTYVCPTIEAIAAHVSDELARSAAGGA
jgi:acyl carrier protein